MCPQANNPVQYLEQDAKQLDEFAKTMILTEAKFGTRSISCAKEIIALFYNPTKRMKVNPFAKIYKDVLDQQFKYHNAYPGQMIKLISSTSQFLNVPIYIVKDKNETFMLVVQDINSASEDTYFVIHMPSKRSDNKEYLEVKWYSHFALIDRMDYLRKHIPDHLNKIGITSEALFKAVSENIESISKLKPGDQSTIQTSTGRQLHILKTVYGEFQILLASQNSYDPFLRVDCLEKITYRSYRGKLLEIKAIQFMKRIEAAYQKFKDPNVTNILNTFITNSDLENIYQYVLETPDILLKLAARQSFRIAKENSAGLARTINIVRDSSGDFMLMLETKTKKADHTKDPQSRIGEGAYARVKQCFRIDTSKPQAWVNKLMKGADVVGAIREATLSQYTLGENGNYNVSVYGQIFTSNKQEIKISQYSPQALTDLKRIIQAKRPDIVLTEENKNKIRWEILNALKYMHDKGLIHQDLKPDNIFISKDAKGHYFAKIGDFGVSHHKTIPYSVIAQYCYESPEIRFANKDPKAPAHNYFFRDRSHPHYFPSYVQGLPEPNPQGLLDFNIPDPANDVFSLGVIFFEFEWGKLPEFTSEDIDRIEADPLLKGCLALERKNRFTIDDAIAVFEKSVKASQAPIHVGSLHFRRPYIKHDKENINPGNKENLSNTSQEIQEIMNTLSQEINQKEFPSTFHIFATFKGMLSLQASENLTVLNEKIENILKQIDKQNDHEHTRIKTVFNEMKNVLNHKKPKPIRGRL